MSDISVEGLESKIEAMEARLAVLRQMLELARSPLFQTAYAAEPVPASNKPRVIIATAPPAENGSFSRKRLSKAAYGELKAMVSDCLPTAVSTKSVTTADIVLKMQSRGYVFTAKSPMVSVNEALVSLELDGKAQRIGKRGLSTVWAAASDDAATKLLGNQAEKGQDQQQTPP